MKQTTIKIHIVEDIAGATLYPLPCRRLAYDCGYDPKPEERNLAKLILGEDLIWNLGKYLSIKPMESGLDWWKELGERLLRVCSNRNVKTKASISRTFPNGLIKEVKVTAFWDKEKIPLWDREAPGYWTLREHSSVRSARGKVLCRIDATLECTGEDLYCHLPAGDVPDGWEVFPDYGDISVMPTSGNNKWWSFKFHKTRQPKYQITQP